MALIGKRTKPHPEAITDIMVYPVAVEIGLPPAPLALKEPLRTRTNLLGVEINYVLYPNCRPDHMGEPLCLYYVAYNQHTRRNEFVVGPGQLDQFDRAVGTFVTAAGNFFGLTGYCSDHEVSTAAAGTLVLKGEIVAAARKLGNSWLQALQHPGWWVQTVGAHVAAGTVPASAAARINKPASLPAVARALRTQLNLQGKTVTRSVQILEQPTIFRHTITADVPPASFAQIEKCGNLRLSTGSKAHYGEGLYVYGQGGPKGARYIDIEVPPGVAAELLSTPQGSWYRLVPAEGDVVPVRIVGHNFSDAEVAMGRLLAAD